MASEESLSWNEINMVKCLIRARVPDDHDELRGFATGVKISLGVEPVFRTLKESELNEFDVIIGSVIDPLQEEECQMLQRFMSQGGALFIFCDTHVSAESICSVNHLLEPIGISV